MRRKRPPRPGYGALRSDQAQAGAQPRMVRQPRNGPLAGDGALVGTNGEDLEAGGGASGGEHERMAKGDAKAAGGGQTALPTSEPRWPSALAVLAAIALYVSLPSKIASGSYGGYVLRFLAPALELMLLIPLAVTAPHRHISESGRRRKAALGLIAIVSLANVVALVFLVHYLLGSSGAIHGRQLLLAAAQIWWTNVIVFALWYWELDGGGPPARLRNPEAPRDFAFVQMTDEEVAAPGWHPRFSDYLYVSFTNSSAFSPTDTMPLTRWAKQLMMMQATVSLVTLLLVAARAVNILQA